MRYLVLVLALSVVACDDKTSPGPGPNPNPNPSATATPTATPTADGGPAPGPANLALMCRSPQPTCENPGFDLAVLGDRVTCETQGGGTSIRVNLASSNDPRDGIIIAFDGYHGPDTYLLDTPGSRFLSVEDHVDMPQCTGAPINVGKRVSAADPNCGSPACTVRVTDAAATAPFPKSLTFTVHCTSLCENGNDVICSNPIDFSTRADCL